MFFTKKEHFLSFIPIIIKEKAKKASGKIEKSRKKAENF